MSEVTIDVQRVMDALAGAFDHGNDVALADIASRQVRRTGRLASSYSLSTTYSDGRWWWNYVQSNAPYARAIERGAWVKGRGPHIHRGNSVVKTTVRRVYTAAVKAAMPAGYRPRRTFIRGARIVYR